MLQSLKLSTTDFELKAHNDELPTSRTHKGWNETSINFNDEVRFGIQRRNPQLADGMQTTCDANARWWKTGS